MATIDYFAYARGEVSRLRRSMGGESPERFAQVYLPQHCSKPFSRMHRELFDVLAEMVDKRSGRLAIAAPRGHAKSTIVSLAFILWCVLYEKEKLVLLVSATKEQVILLLRAVKDELQKNGYLLEDFPEICLPESAPGQPKPWRDNRILLRNGAMISAYGAGQGLRGAKIGSNRPGLIVVDDLEDPEQVIYEEQRQKLLAWFNGTLLHAGHPNTNVVVVGTVLHHDSLLAGLTHPDDSHGWTGLTYKAIERWSDRPELWGQWLSIYRGKEDFEGRTGSNAAESFFESNRVEMLQGTRVLWPELEDYPTLMKIRENGGRASFQAEKQNEPIDPEVCIFAEKNFHYWDDEYADVDTLLDALGRDGDFFGACDPSLGSRPGRGDYTGIVILYRPKGSKINYVIVADVMWRTPDETIERIIEYARMYRLRQFVVESNQFQVLMVDDLRRRAVEAGVKLPIYPVTNRSNKQARIASLEPEVTQGRIRFYRRHQLLLEQLLQFPVAKNDDGPDALEMAVDMSRKCQTPEGRAEVIIMPPLEDTWANG
ncbi:MAG: phage terminase large subunit [Acidobacteria bacterium]|nr:phage terminase large subunit [Acidobacteriota bacterium]